MWPGPDSRRAADWSRVATVCEHTRDVVVAQGPTMLKRALDLCGPVAALAVALLSAGRPCGRLVRARHVASRPHLPTEIGGMTVDERLACLGLFPDWDAAFLARDRAKLIEIATRLEIADPAFTVDTTLADPAKHGRR